MLSYLIYVTNAVCILNQDQKYLISALKIWSNTVPTEYKSSNPSLLHLLCTPNPNNQCSTQSAHHVELPCGTNVGLPYSHMGPIWVPYENADGVYWWSLLIPQQHSHMDMGMWASFGCIWVPMGPTWVPYNVGPIWECGNHLGLLIGYSAVLRCPQCISAWLCTCYRFTHSLTFLCTYLIFLVIYAMNWICLPNKNKCSCYYKLQSPKSPSVC